MNIPKTNTSTATTSSQKIQDLESKAEQQTVSKEVQPSAATDSKASQGLAEENKSAYGLTAQLQKNQLQQKLPSSSTLDQLSSAHRLDSKQLEDLKSFAKQNGVPEKELAKVGNNSRYSGSEKMEAMKAYAIAYDAAHNGKMNPLESKRIKEHFLPNLAEGKIGIRQTDMSSARAQYNSLNVGNKARYEPNTMYLPKEGLNLSSPQDRSTLMHESNHAAQDAQRRKMSFMDSEAEGHSAGMGYLLRDGGAIVDTPQGPKLDFDKFNDMLHKTGEATDKKQLIELFAQAAEKNERAGKKHLNGILADTKDAGYIIRTQVPHLSRQTFEETYIKSLKENPQNSDKSDIELRQKYNRSVPHDGI